MAPDQPKKNREAPPRKRDLATRDEILYATADLIVSRGYSACTMRSISEKVNIKAGSLYYHFASKDEIVVEIMNSGAQMLLDHVKSALEALAPDTPFAVRLETAVRHHLEGILNRDLPFMRVYEHLMPVTKRQGRHKRRLYAALWHELIEGGRAEGAVRADLATEPLVSFVLSALNSTPDWVPAGEAGHEDLIRLVLSVIGRGILSAEG